MKKTLFILSLIVIGFASCSDNDEKKNILEQTEWRQTINDEIHRFTFPLYDSKHDIGEVEYYANYNSDQPSKPDRFLYNTKVDSVYIYAQDEDTYELSVFLRGIVSGVNMNLHNDTLSFDLKKINSW